jgi:hypothetical protein
MMVRTVPASLLLLAGLWSILLVGCLETVSPEPKPAAAVSPRSKTKAETPATAQVSEVRRRLHADCIVEVGGLLGADEKRSKQCDCYADAIVKALRKEDLDFYLTYNIVPTLTVAKPEEVKKSCGIVVVDQPGTRGKLAPPQGH